MTTGGNNNTVPEGAVVLEGELGHEMAAFDALPRAAREAMRAATFDISAIDVARQLEERASDARGLPQSIEAHDQGLAREFRRSLGMWW